MTDFLNSNGYCPLIALLSSNAADSLVEKNQLTIADLLAPFCSTLITIEDPNGQQITKKLHIDIRDIRKSGFLLSHTVLPYVLHQGISSLSNDLNKDESTFTMAFADLFLYWLEPAEHDFLRKYLCCIFVVSTNDDDPLGELDRLQYQQHLQQHGGNEASTSLSPAHCCSPKWMIPNILKYYVLIEDISNGNNERTKEIYNSLIAKYKSNCCHLLRINSTNTMEMPDPWAKLLEKRYAGLESGLRLARRTLLAKTNVDNGIEADKLLNKYPSSVISRSSSTVSSFAYINSLNPSPGSTNSQQSPLFTTSSAMAGGCGLNELNSSKLISDDNNSMDKKNNSTLPNNSNNNNNNTDIYGPNALSIQETTVIEKDSQPILHGQCLDQQDRDRIKNFIEEFVRSALVPFVERQLVAQNEILANRRSIGKSFSNVRKWLSAASTSTTNTPVTYGMESSESQTRCLADMAFQFGLYNFSYQLYQSLKKDFANDQAWINHAGALEMAAFSSYLASSYTSKNNQPKLDLLADLKKNYPQRYMDNAINYYQNICIQPLLSLRCTIISTEILTKLGLYNEAANQIIQLNNLNFPDLYNAILLEHSAQLFNCSMFRRKMAFYSILGGHRYAKAGLKQFSLACYLKALPLFLDKGWCFAEDQILYTLTSQNLFDSNEKLFVVELASKLLRHFGCQNPNQQVHFLWNYLKILTKYGIEMPEFCLPLVNASKIRCFYGDSYGMSKATYSASSTNSYSNLKSTTIFNNNENSNMAFLDMEKTLITLNSHLKVMNLFSDNSTDNRNVKLAPAFEPITFQIELSNPLTIPLILRNIRLGVTDIQMFPEYENSLENSFQEIFTLPELILSPYQSWESLQTGYVVVEQQNNNNILKISNNKTIDLFIIPTDKIEKFSINRLCFDLFCRNENEGSEIFVSGFIPLKVRGKKLFATKEQRLKKTYAIDNRLKIQMSKLTWPLLNIRMAGNAGKQEHVNAYCNQMYQIITDLENIGHQPIHEIYICTDQSKLVSISEIDPEQSDQWMLCEARLFQSSIPTAYNDENENRAILVQKIQTITMERPCLAGQKFSLRLAFRAPAEPIKDCKISVLFFYVGENGSTRQFRYRLFLSTQNLLSTRLQTLNHTNGLCVMSIQNLISRRDSVLAKIELQKFAIILLAKKQILSQQKSSQKIKEFLVKNVSASNPFNIIIKPVTNRQIILESEQTQNYCFYLNFGGGLESQGYSSNLWISDYVPDIPVWSHLLPIEEFASNFGELKIAQQNLLPEEIQTANLAHLRLAILWKAYIANSDGTVATVFGENLIANPFANTQSHKGICRIPGNTQLDIAFILSPEELEEFQRNTTQKIVK